MYKAEGFRFLSTLYSNISDTLTNSERPFATVREVERAREHGWIVLGLAARNLRPLRVAVDGAERHPLQAPGAQRNASEINVEMFIIMSNSKTNNRGRRSSPHLWASAA